MSLSSSRFSLTFAVLLGLVASADGVEAQETPPAPQADAPPVGATPAPTNAAPAEASAPSATPAQAPAAPVVVQPMAVRIVEEPEPWRPNRVSFGPLGLVFGIGSFTYERALNDRFSLEASPTFIYFGFGDDKIYGGGLSVGGSLYLTGRAPEGLRLNASVGPGFVSFNPSEGETKTVFLFSTKLTFGYNWVWSSGFSMGLAAGAQYVHIAAEDVDSAFNGLLPSIDFNLGFAF